MKMNFLKLNVLALVLFFCSSCQTPATNAESAVVKDSIAVGTTPIETSATSDEKTGESLTIIYRSDGFRPGLASEWISVKSVEVGDTQKITEMWYWSTADEKKIPGKIVSQKFTSGEMISGYTGEVLFQEGGTPDGFSIMEDILSFGSNDNGQEFTQEESVRE